MADETHHTPSERAVQRATGWLPIVFRVVVALILTPAAVLKFVNYGEEVAAFASYGIPVPEVAVPLVGVVELVAAVSIGLGIAGRFGALTIVPVMVIAMLTAGVYLSNVIVLAGCLGIVLAGTGSYAVFRPEIEFLGRSGHGTPGEPNQ